MARCVGRQTPHFTLRQPPLLVWLRASLWISRGAIASRFVIALLLGDSQRQEVQTILTQGIQTAYALRAAIREPQDSFVQVNIFVVDVDGAVLGYLGTPDAPFFGFDVSAQKARAAAFFSGRNAGSDLRVARTTTTVPLGSFVDRAQQDGIAFDGSIAFSNRACGIHPSSLFPRRH